MIRWTCAVSCALVASMGSATSIAEARAVSLTGTVGLTHYDLQSGALTPFKTLSPWGRYGMALSPDGQRFIVNLPLEWTSAAPITVVTNWTEKLKE